MEVLRRVLGFRLRAPSVSFVLTVVGGSDRDGEVVAGRRGPA
jgi:hypothetical protein